MKHCKWLLFILFFHSFLSAAALTEVGGQSKIGKRYVNSDNVFVDPVVQTDADGNIVGIGGTGAYSGVSVVSSVDLPVYGSITNTVSVSPTAGAEWNVVSALYLPVSIKATVDLPVYGSITNTVATEPGFAGGNKFVPNFGPDTDSDGMAVRTASAWHDTGGAAASISVKVTEAANTQVLPVTGSGEHYVVLSYSISTDTAQELELHWGAGDANTVNVIASGYFTAGDGERGEVAPGGLDVGEGPITLDTHVTGNATAKVIYYLYSN